MRDIGDVRLAMAGVFEASSTVPSVPTDAVEMAIWQRPLGAAVMIAVALVAGGLAVATLSGGDPPPPTRRFTLTLPEPERLPGVTGRALALSPDGQTLVYRVIGDGLGRLIRRPLAQFEATSVVEGGGLPFFSPDGQWLGFFEYGTNRALKKAALAGGPAQTLTTLPASLRGAHWGPDDTIVYGVASIGWRPDAGLREWRRTATHLHA